MEKDVAVLILGASEGSYAACRSFYTEFGIQPTVLDNTLPDLFFRSRFVRGRSLPFFKLSLPALALRILEEEGEALGKRVLLLPGTPACAAFLAEWEAALSPHFILPCGTPPVLPYEEGEGLPSGRLVACVDGESEGLFCYGRTPLYQNGAPAYFRTADLPEALLPLCDRLKREGFGIFTFPIWERDGRLLVGKPASDLSALPFFATAADRSPAEFLLFRFILCQTPPSPTSPTDGIYRILGKGRILRLLSNGSVRTDFRHLCRRGWEMGLFDAKGEKRSPSAALARADARRGYGDFAFSQTEKGNIST